MAEGFIRRAVNELVPYEPGKPVEEVQRELGLDRVVKLASNEGQFGPFREALEAIARGAPQLNRYPDGGAYRLRTALADKHGVEFENVAVAAGADAVVMYLSLAVLDPGDVVDLLEMLRDEHGLTASSGAARAPRAATIADIYTRSVNTGRPAREVVTTDFPWSDPHVEQVLRDRALRHGVVEAALDLVPREALAEGPPVIGVETVSEAVAHLRGEARKAPTSVDGAALLASIPRLHHWPERLVTIEGAPPSLAGAIVGCPFEPRCGFRVADCARELPPLVEVNPGHWARCPVVNPA